MLEAPSATAFLAVQDLCFHYGNRCAVDHLSFEVQQSECFGLLGPNGAGKSSTLACVAGLLNDWTGELLLEGEAVRPAEEPPIRRRFGLVPQDLAVYGELAARLVAGSSREKVLAE